jgi:hypothetical protein
MTWFRASTWGQVVAALLVGGFAFAAIWLAGFPESAYLGFVGAAVVWGATARGARARDRCWPRLGHRDR